MFSIWSILINIIFLRAKKEEIGYIDVTLDECPDYKVYMKEGKMYKNFEIIEVE